MDDLERHKRLTVELMKPFAQRQYNEGVSIKQIEHDLLMSGFTVQEITEITVSIHKTSDT